MLGLILFLVIAVPLAWLASEFQPRTEIRIALGIAAIAMSFGVAWIVGSLERLNSNIWFGSATKDLIQVCPCRVSNVRRRDFVLARPTRFDAPLSMRRLTHGPGRVFR